MTYDATCVMSNNVQEINDFLYDVLGYSVKVEICGSAIAIYMMGIESELLAVAKVGDFLVNEDGNIHVYTEEEFKQHFNIITNNE